MISSKLSLMNGTAPIVMWIKFYTYEYDGN